MYSGTETDEPKPAITCQRVLLVMPEHWSRVLLRAELIERGHDTLGAPSFRTALLYPPAKEQRGPVRVILVDDGALLNADRRYLLAFTSASGPFAASIEAHRSGSKMNEKQGPAEH